MTSLPVLLSKGFSPLVKSGDVVTVGQILAQNIYKDDVIINLPNDLAIPLAKVKKVLKKNPGDTLSEGEIIAVKKSFLGVHQDAIISRISGTILRYERDTGNLVIKTSYATLTENLLSPVDGTVALCDNEKIII